MLLKPSHEPVPSKKIILYLAFTWTPGKFTFIYFFLTRTEPWNWCLSLGQFTWHDVSLVPSKMFYLKREKSLRCVPKWNSGRWNYKFNGRFGQADGVDTISRGLNTHSSFTLIHSSLLNWTSEILDRFPKTCCWILTWSVPTVKAWDTVWLSEFEDASSELPTLKSPSPFTENFSENTKNFSHDVTASSVDQNCSALPACSQQFFPRFFSFREDEWFRAEQRIACNNFKV